MVLVIGDIIRIADLEGSREWKRKLAVHGWQAGSNGWIIGGRRRKY